jgi:hypothetical protein
LAMVMKTVKQAVENMEYVRRLLRQNQPGFAASLELAAAQLEGKLREPALTPQNHRDARCSAAGLAFRGAMKRATAGNIQDADLLTRACQAGDPAGYPRRAGGASS